MNTKQPTENNATDSSVQHFNSEEINRLSITASSGKVEDNIIINEAKIVTPHPYGVFALCKIYELLQIN